MSRNPSLPAEPPLAELAGLRHTTVVVFLVSLALLSAQVTVTRLLAYRFYYHYVFLIISLAQLGLAAAGAWIYASGRRSWNRRDLAGWLLRLALAPLVILVCYSWLGPAPNLSLAKVDGGPAHLFIVYFSPLLVGLNFCGGMVLTMVFATFKERIGRLYAGDLAGAAGGCLASVLLMITVGPIRAFLAAGLAALGAAVLVLATTVPSQPQSSSTDRRPRSVEASDAQEPSPLPEAGVGHRAQMHRPFRVRGAARGRPKTSHLWPTAAVLGALLGLAWTQPYAFDPNLLHRQVADRILRSVWNHLARTDAFHPSYYIIDGDASSNLVAEGRIPADPEYRLVRPEPEVAILGVGAGPQLRTAVLHNARRVLAIDINPTVIAWSLDDDRKFNRDLFHRPEVELRVGEGRHLLSSAERPFDLVVMHAIDTWTASAQGAYSLTENFLYTSEAMGDFLSRLHPGGVVSIRRWLFSPPRENLRLFSTVHHALEASGVDHPERHQVVLTPNDRFADPGVRTWGYLLFSNAPFDDRRLAILDAYVEAQAWTYLYRPGRPVGTAFDDFIAAPDKQAFSDRYPYIVTPARDDNPFFFQLTLPWSTAGTGGFDQALYSQTATVLIVCFLVCAGLSLLLLGVPLYLRRRDFAGDPQRASSLCYFASLGVGFMAFELPAIQVMTLYLGHPTYALSVVLLGLLAAAGLGSALMGRLPLTVAPAVLGSIAVLAVGSAFGLLPLVHRLIELPDAARFLSTLVYLALVGVPLGMPFVAGIRRLCPGRPHQVAWAWAANGAAAVVGSCLLMIVMVYAGSRQAFLVAAAAYALAFLAHRRLA